MRFGIRFHLLAFVAALFATQPTWAEEKPAGDLPEVARLTELHKSKQWDKENELMTQLLAGDPKYVTRVLARVLDDQSIATRSHIVARIVKARLKLATGILVNLLNDPEKGMRTCAVIALGDFKKSPVAEYHLGLRMVTEHDKEKYVRLSLAKLGQPYLQYYVSGLSDPDSQRRQWAMLGLSELKDKRSVPHLVKLLDSDATWDASFAARSIEAITGIPGTIIIKTTKRPDGSVSTQGKRRPVADIKRDVAKWIAKHKKEVQQPIEASRERWVYTPQGLLYSDVIPVLYKGMSPSEVEAMLGHPVRYSEAGSVWTYLKDRSGATLTLVFGLNGLDGWQVERKE